MRRWGIVVSGCYLAAVLFFLHPLFAWLFDKDNPLNFLLKMLTELVTVPLWWAWIAMLIGGQALLLFLSVDTSWRRLRPRQHIIVTGCLAGALTALLAFGAIWGLAFGIEGEKAFGWPYSPFKGGEVRAQVAIAAWWAALWIVWTIVFYLYYRNSSAIVSAAVGWLLKGSVLELLIAIPAHVMVRHRNDCSAPLVTSWGIVTGIAIMLLCFGPSVLALYKKRIEGYSNGRNA